MSMGICRGVQQDLAGHYGGTPLTYVDKRICTASKAEGTRQREKKQFVSFLIYSEESVNEIETGIGK